MADEPTLKIQNNLESEPTFEAYKEEWLSDVREGSPSTIELAGRFTNKLLTQWLDVGNVLDDLVYCDGSGDGGIDAAYLVRGEAVDGDADDASEGDTWYLECISKPCWRQAGRE